MGEMMISYFSQVDWIVFLALFVAGGPYWVILDLWEKYWPGSYELLVFFQVIIGVSYVLFGLAFILPEQYWLRVMVAFIFASMLIIVRSIIIIGRQLSEAMKRIQE